VDLGGSGGVEAGAMDAPADAGGPGEAGGGGEAGADAVFEAGGEAGPADAPIEGPGIGLHAKGGACNCATAEAPAGPGWLLPLLAAACLRGRRRSRRATRLD
jgi:MYXO-CTERM domain-containing protein